MSLSWSSRVRGPLQALAGGAVLSAVTDALSRWPPGWGATNALDLPVVGGFVSGLLFGWYGAAGTVLWSLGASAMLDWTSAGSRVLTQALIGGFAFEAFRRCRGVGRALPNLRSYQLLIAVAALASLIFAVVLAVDRVLPGPFDDVVWLAFAGTVVSILLLAPVFTIPILRFAPGITAPIEGERRPEPFERWRLQSLRSNGPLELVLLPRARWHKLAPLVLFVAVATLAWLGRFAVTGVETWISMLYAWPILWAGSVFGLRAALLGAAVGGLLVLTKQPFDVQRANEVHQQWVEQYPMLIFFSIGGALWGGMREREGRLNARIAEANRELRRDLERTVKALRSAIEAKDSYTEGHLGRVAEFALEVGRRLGLAGRELEILEVASVLHDVGKIGIPEQVLRKAGALDDDERLLMQQHPEIGARILERTEGLRDAAPLVLHHQERWDGCCDGVHPGYPRGLQGEEIPLGARIIAVVDAFDAMTSDRPYRASLGLESAIAVLRRERGSQFDPRVVDVFLIVLDERVWRL